METSARSAVRARTKWVWGLVFAPHVHQGISHWLVAWQLPLVSVTLGLRGRMEEIARFAQPINTKQASGLMLALIVDKTLSLHLVVHQSTSVNVIMGRRNK